MKKYIVFLSVIVSNNSFAMDLSLGKEIPSGYENPYNNEFIIKKNNNEYFIVDKSSSFFKNKIAYVDNKGLIYKVSESSYNKFKTSNINECLFMLNKITKTNMSLSKNVYLNNDSTLFVPQKGNIKTFKYLYTNKEIDSEKYFISLHKFFNELIPSSQETMLDFTNKYKKQFKDYYPISTGSLSCEYKNDFYYINRERRIDFADMLMIEDNISKNKNTGNNKKINEMYGIKIGTDSRAYKVLRYTTGGKKEFETIPPEKDEDNYIDTYIINDDGNGINFIEGKSKYNRLNFEECLNKIYYNLEKYNIENYNLQIDETLKGLWLFSDTNFSTTCFDENNDGKYYFEKDIHNFNK